MRRLPWVLLGLVACAPPAAPVTPGPATGDGVELVESWPLETTLGNADVRDAKDVWPELVDGAKLRLDFAEFYASDDPKGPSALTPVVEAIERAAKRGVKVRWLADAKMAKTYPELLGRFAAAGVRNVGWVHRDDDGRAGEELLDLYTRQRRTANVEQVQANSISNKNRLEARDPAVRRRNFEELRQTAADPARNRQFLLTSSMIESVARAGRIT